MQKQTTAISHEIIRDSLNPHPPALPSLLSIEQFCKVESAFTPGGLRHLLFVNGHDIPGIHRFGRRILVDRDAFIAGIKAGSAAVIAGRGCV